jgi:hypothetical protein
MYFFPKNYNKNGNEDPVVAGYWDGFVVIGGWTVQIVTKILFKKKKKKKKKRERWMVCGY